MAVMTSIIGAGRDGATAWSDAKTDFYLTFLSRLLAFERLAESEPRKVCAR